MIKPTTTQSFRYPYEEFTDHIKAMRTVREWEYTSRFGHLGRDQSSRSNAARAVEYFSDTYEDSKEAIYKAGVFLSIYDYIGRHETLFERHELVEKSGSGLVLVDPALLRAVHYLFTVVIEGDRAAPKKVLGLAKAFREIDRLV
ncbi:MAG TPA: hypothetical protein VN673_13495 [Clostridia bacterium]|nr:hypothetical protein [Clostridia bacterium]